MDFTLRNMYTIIMNWGWLHGYDNGDFEDGDNADNFMGGGPLGILLYQMRYSGRCSVFYIELLLEDIDWEGKQNSNHIVVGFPTSGWVSNQWLEIHPWWVNFQPFTLVGLGAVVRKMDLNLSQTAIVSLSLDFFSFLYVATSMARVILFIRRAIRKGFSVWNGFG